MNESYKKLIVYQKSKELVLYIYKITNGFPKSEVHVLIPQMRRAAISIMANVVEGYSKDSSKEYSRFLTISIGSLVELEVFLDLSKELGFIKTDEFDRIIKLLLETKRLLFGTRKSVRLSKAH